MNQSLPNITGSITKTNYGLTMGDFTTEGVFSNSSKMGIATFMAANGSITCMHMQSFDASLSNSIYQNGSNVRPKHYVVEYYIKYK